VLLYFHYAGTAKSEGVSVHVKNIWMPVEFHRIEVGCCTSLIQQVLTSTRPGNFPNHCWSAYYIKTPLKGICEKSARVVHKFYPVAEGCKCKEHKKSEQERVYARQTLQQ